MKDNKYDHLFELTQKDKEDIIKLEEQIQKIKDKKFIQGFLEECREGNLNNIKEMLNIKNISIFYIINGIHLAFDKKHDHVIDFFNQEYVLLLPFEIKQLMINESFIVACSYGRMDYIKKLLMDKTLPLNADINYRDEANMISCLKNNKPQVLNYLVTSSELDKHLQFSGKKLNAIFTAIDEMEESTMKYLVLEMKIPKEDYMLIVLNKLRNEYPEYYKDWQIDKLFEMQKQIKDLKEILPIKSSDKKMKI